ncbi:MAG: YunC family protein [Tumebacillaceae bacterium]
MINVIPITFDDRIALGISVTLPKTNLVMVTTELGYIMCGALDVGLLNAKLADRGIVAARAVGVKTLDELLAAPMESVTVKAAELGITPGTIGRDAIRLMLNASTGNTPHS